MARKKAAPTPGDMDPIDAAREYAAEQLGEAIADSTFVRQLQTMRVFTLGGGSVVSPEDAKLIGVYAQAWVAGFKAAEREKRRNTGHGERTKAAAERDAAMREAADKMRAENKSPGVIVATLSKRYHVGRATVYSALGGGR